MKRTHCASVPSCRYIQFTMDSILTHPDGLQLMVESAWLWGIILYLLVELMSGTTREKLIVSYIRCRGQVEISNIDAICSLCREFVAPPAPDPKKSGRRGRKDQSAVQQAAFGYEEFFSRFPLDEFLITTMIARLRSEDIYNMASRVLCCRCCCCCTSQEISLLPLSK